MDVKSTIDKTTVKKIFSIPQAKEYLKQLGKDNVKTKEVLEKVVSTWKYPKSLKLIRAMFFDTDKYREGKAAGGRYQELLREWDINKLGPIKWPCAQGQFETIVQEINNREISSIEKDEEVELKAIQYRRMKELNTARNDFLEIKMFEENQNLLPTLIHRRNVDYFINGESFDQKVSASPTKQFKEKYGDNWKTRAKEHPEEVAQFLYKYQSEERFDAGNRLLIVYLDDNIPLSKIEETIKASRFNSPIIVPFDFEHKKAGTKHYSAKCFVILLSNS